MNITREMILKSFIVESEEGLAQMEQSILALECRPEDGELIQTIFRVVHTMKGNAAILELERLRSFSHTLEDLLDSLRRGEIGVTTEIISLLLACLDHLRQSVATAGEGRAEDSHAGESILTRISRYLRSCGDAENRKAAQESASPTVAGIPQLPQGSALKESTRTLRVDVDKLDRLLNLAGEISIVRGRLSQLLAGKDNAGLEAILEAHRFAGTLHLELQETILKTRMVPVGPLFHQFSRTVRDLAKSHGKLAQLQIAGEEVEVDTSVVEHLKDPLLHMIRNAIDHGIEAPSVRVSCGKAPTGTISVRAAHAGGSLVIEVCDDGAGLDRQKIIETAQRRGLGGELEKLADEELSQLIFESGFTTATEVTDLSGRGIGMDVVRRNVQALRGRVHIASQSGAGSQVQIRLPLTLAMIEGFGVGVGEETYVIPVDQVIECLDLPAEENHPGRTEGILQVRGEALPFLYLKDHFALPGVRPGRQNIVIVHNEGEQAGLAVDELYGATPTVIKPLHPLFKSVPGVSGSAILGNGRVALILDVPALLRNFRSERAAAVGLAGAAARS